MSEAGGNPDSMADVNAVLVADLHAAGNDRSAIVAAFGRFIDAGLPVCGSPSALWDHLSATLWKAGYDRPCRDRRTRIYGTVSHQRFGGGRPLGADWPWHEHPEADPD
jgi:hypothetical protein